MVSKMGARGIRVMYPRGLSRSVSLSNSQKPTQDVLSNDSVILKVVCVCVCVCVCMYVLCMCLCMYVCMYVCTYVGVYVCMYVHLKRNKTSSTAIRQQGGDRRTNIK